MEFDNKQKVIVAVILLVVGYILFIQNQHLVTENRDLILVVVGALVGAVVMWILMRGATSQAFLDPKEAMRLFFNNTNFGRDLGVYHDVPKMGEGSKTIPVLNLGQCEIRRRGDGTCEVYGPIFKGASQWFSAVFDLRKRQVSDLDSNLIYWAPGPIETKSFEKESERLVPFESSQAMRLARKAQSEAEKREAEAMAEEM